MVLYEGHEIEVHIHVDELEIIDLPMYVRNDNLLVLIKIISPYLFFFLCTSDRLL